MNNELNNTLDILYACGFVQALNQADLLPLSEYEQEALDQESAAIDEGVRQHPKAMYELLNAAETLVKACEELSTRVTAREDKFEVFRKAAQRLKQFHFEILSPKWTSKKQA